MIGRSGSLALALLLVGCTPAEATLIVQVRTDLMPVAELGSVRTELGGALVSTFTADMRRPWGVGVRVAELVGLTPGEVRLDVTAFAPDGTVIVQRPVRVSLEEGTRVVTVLLSRSCAGVTCDDPAASACLAGRCVPAGCVEDDPSECTAPECMSEMDCPAVSACAMTECTPSGTCFGAPDHDFCDTGQVCHNELGCVPVEGPGGDSLFVDDDAIGAPIQDGSVDFPYESIEAALAVAVSGDRIMIFAGNYTPVSIEVTTDGVLIIGAGTADVRVAAPTAGADDTAFIISAHDVQLSGMQIVNYGGGVAVAGVDRVGLANLDIIGVARSTGATTGIAATSADALTLLNITVQTVEGASMQSDQPVRGVYLRDLTGCTITNLRVSDIAGDEGSGILAAPDVTGLQMQNISNCELDDVSVRGVTGGRSADVTSGEAGRGGAAVGIRVVDSYEVHFSRLLVADLEGGAGGDASGSGSTSGNGGSASAASMDVDDGSLHNVTITGLTGGAAGLATLMAVEGVPSNTIGLSIRTETTFLVRSHIVADANICVFSQGSAPVDLNDGITHACDTRLGELVMGRGYTGGSMSMNIDPQFVDADYHLSPGSPAVDLGEPSRDCSLEPSPNGCQINAGYYGGSIDAAARGTASHCDVCPMTAP